MPMSDEKLQINWLTKVGGLRQAYRAGLEFCMLSADNRQATKFVFCKDYFQDALMGIHHEVAVGPIFGFCYDPKTDVPICTTQTRLVIVNASDEKFAKSIPNMLDFINRIEKKMKLVRTTAHEVVNADEKYASGCYAIVGSQRWQLSPPMLSLYTLLIRVGFCHSIGDDPETTINNLIAGRVKPYQRDDAILMKAAKPGFDKIIKHGYARIFYKDAKKNFPRVEVGVMHGSFGIVGFSNGYTTNHVKHWHRDVTAKKKKKKADQPKETVA